MIKRQIIYTAAMQIEVFDAVKAREKIEAVVQKIGGYVQEATSYSIVVRLPATQLQSTLADFRNLGRVDE